MKSEILLRMLAGVLVALCAVYIGDYLVLRIRAWTNGPSSTLGTATVYDAATLKDNKIEVFYNQPQIETCVHALFPHLGYPSCWYVRRNPIKRID
jgi:hypothetical protein